MKRNQTHEYRLDRRAAGVLLHPTSLPGPHGSGDLGAEARRFLDFLSRAAMSWWQMLPTGPIGPANSPYASSSAFAGNPLLIDPQGLVQAGLLKSDELAPLRSPWSSRVDFPQVIRRRMSALRHAHRRFQDGGGATDAEYIAFCSEHAPWLDDYALFSAIQSAYRGRFWNLWPAPLRDRRRRALQLAAVELRDKLDFHRFVQFEFARQWESLRAAAHSSGIGLIGDIPIFSAFNSADVWANRKLFAVDGRGRCRAVTGCPPDDFNADGQLWGHPQYDWREHEKTGFAWWVWRFRHMLRQFDAVRIDHFLGFRRVWWLAGQARTARHGRWAPSPGDELFSAVRRALGPVQVIAEDLGATTPEAFALRDRFGFPGMRVMTFGFGGDDAGSHYQLPHTYVPNCVAFTGTHDNDPVVAWLEKVRMRDRRGRHRAELTELGRIHRYFGGTSSGLHWQMIRALYASVANLVVTPVQDLLGLGAEHRMNTPGTVRRNWEWRMPPGALKPELAGKLASLAAAFGRGIPL